MAVPKPSTRSSTTLSRPTGESVTIGGLNFIAGFVVTNTGPDPTTVKVQIELPAGLHWGNDGPDPSEDCTVGETSVCNAALGVQGNNDEAALGWDVVADAVGSYTLKVQVVESLTSDPDTSDNASSVTVVVTQPAKPKPPPKLPAAVAAGAVKVSPAKPKAGSTVVASVRVTSGGSPVRPTGIACAATIGKTKVKGGAKSSSGAASCLFKTPKTGKGKTMLGSISFKAGGRASRRVSRSGLASEALWPAEDAAREPPTCRSRTRSSSYISAPSAGLRSTRGPP